MTRRQKAFDKIERLQSENNELRCNINNILKQKDRLNYQYMDNPICDVKLHRKKMIELKKLYDKCIYKLNTNNNEISRLRLMYSL